MGNISCSAEDVTHLAAVARDFCPYADYSLGPLYNMLSANSSQLLSEHYAAVQASLTPQQQQDFTQSLRSTFGQEGKVIYGGVGFVALSLAVLFDTVARQLKGECVSKQEPIPGLFVKEPSGDYSPAVYVISKYLRLVPHIANNPEGMIEKTEKHLLELNHAFAQFMDTVETEKTEDTAVVNAMRCSVIGEHMSNFLKNVSDKNIDLDTRFLLLKRSQVFNNINCDPRAASERFVSGLPVLGNRTKEALENCELNDRKMTVIEAIMELDLSFNIFVGYASLMKTGEFIPQRGFDLKANALGRWN